MSEWFVNPNLGRRLPAGALDASASDVGRFHRRLPLFQATPLHDLGQTAELVGVGRVLLKDESERAGMPSFKILGASWATYRALLDVVGEPLDLDRWEDLSEVGGIVRQRSPIRRLVAATDGNHGRAVARMASWLGLGATIVVPDSMTAARRDAIRSEGAELVVVPGTYGRAVEQSAALAAEEALVVSDTSWDGYHTIPRYISEGYVTLFAETAEQSPCGVDVVVVQMGVGALAAAAVAFAWSNTSRSRVLGVEAVGSACIMRSIREGRLVTVPGPHPSVMAGLNCDSPSPVAWPVISAGIDAFVEVSDESAGSAMAALARVGVTSGEAGAAGLAGLFVAAAEPALAEALDLGPDTTVLVISTEGATDPDHYAALVAAHSQEWRR